MSVSPRHSPRQDRRPSRLEDPRPSQRQVARRRAVALAALGVLVIVLLLSVTQGGRGPARSAGSPSGSGPPAQVRATTTRAAVRPPARIPGARKAPFPVGSRELTLEEPASPAIATTTLNGQPVRTLVTNILYPSQGRVGDAVHPGAAPDRAVGPFPLVVFSQGFDESVSSYAALLQSWARAGYVVAAPAYPHTSPAPEGVDESDILNHPADLRYVLSTLLADAGQSSGPLAGLVNPQEVALAGQSDGGDVTLAAAANSCCEIPGVKAAIILSGAELPSFGGTYDTGGSPPLLVVQGSADTINLPGCSAELYDQAPSPKIYVNLLGAEHLPPYTEPGPERNYVSTMVVAFLNAHLRGQTGPLAGLLRTGGEPGVASLSTAPQLAGASTYCP
ncbi:MAG TPA: hypothetical protein VFN48_06310 [Solirubrobacteraceae bacterium]|nr:hypothetical protein [Solirubrobacteraceae bacterium]